MAAMKIVCMIGTPDYLHHFVNEIAAHHELSLVIREAVPLRKNLLKKIRSGNFLSSIRSVMDRFGNRKKTQGEYDAELGPGWRQLSGSFPLFTTPDINSDEVRSKLEQLRPDLVLVHGTSLIRNHVLAGIPLVLNLHWGLSPYYKGSYCTQWALINRDPYNIGYTIHRISAKIDAGDILTQGRVDIIPSDTANRINMRLTRQGTRAMIGVVARYKNGEVPQFKEQDNRKGRLYLVRQWTNRQKKEIAGIENSSAIQDMLNKPVGKPLPIVTW
jgi:methionyl-tRNA formyltransferase